MGRSSSIKSNVQLHTVIVMGIEHTTLEVWGCYANHWSAIIYFLFVLRKTVLRSFIRLFSVSLEHVKRQECKLLVFIAIKANECNWNVEVYWSKTALHDRSRLTGFSKTVQGKDLHWGQSKVQLQHIVLEQRCPFYFLRIWRFHFTFTGHTELT